MAAALAAPAARPPRGPGEAAGGSPPAAAAQQVLAGPAQAVDKASALPLGITQGDTRFGCGLAAGLIVTSVLNPWDRALFLSVVFYRPFFSWTNWRDPYRGLAQTLVQRSISSGLYFPLEDIFTHALGSPLLGGQAAGVVLGALMNPLAYIKYQSWGSETSRNFLSTARKIYRDTGPGGFFRGQTATLSRDAIFGLCFAMRRTCAAEPGSEYETSFNFAVGVGFAAVGTTLSSPFNFIRNLAYAEKTTVPLESVLLKKEFWKRNLGELFAEVRKRGRISRLDSFLWLTQRMQLGWGTLRVGVGMAITDQLYRTLCAAALA